MKTSRAFLWLVSASSVLLLSACGEIPYPTGGPSNLGVKPQPQGATELTASDTQLGQMYGFDVSTLKTFKSVVGAPIEPFRQSEEARFSKALQEGIARRQAEAQQKPETAAVTADEPKEEASADTPSDASTQTGNNPETGNNPPAGSDAVAGAGATPAEDSSVSSLLASRQPGPVIGFAAKVPDNSGQDIAIRYVEALRKELPVGYLPFKTELNNEDCVAVIKNADKYEPVRIAGTAGGGWLHQHSTEDIINKLKEWDQKYKLHVVGAGHDSVEALVENLPPADVYPLAKEVKKFAPGDGSAKASDFEDDLRTNKRIFLWWD